MLTSSSIREYWAFKEPCDDCPLQSAYIEEILREDFSEVDDEMDSYEAYSRLHHTDKPRLEQLIDPPEGKIIYVNAHKCSSPKKRLWIVGNAVCRGNLAIVDLSKFDDLPEQGEE